ncbi:hypothetical protein GGI21_000997, partial [Coemansia aciculifera]
MGNAMSFSVTPEELARVEAFKALNIDLDPRQAADLIMVIVIAVVYFIQLLAVMFMMWNRQYPPIKAKSPWIMLAIFIASLFWFTGDIQANGHAPLKGTPLANCKAFSIWLRMIIGVCTMSLLITIRSYSLYQVFCRNRPFIGVQLYASVGFMAGTLLTFGIVTAALSPLSSVYYMDGLDVCGYNVGYEAFICAFVWVLCLFIAALRWHTRNIKSSFNESREITITLVIVFAVMIFMTVLSFGVAYYPTKVKARILSTALNHFAAAAIWWLPMAAPIYNCLTNRDKYLKMWIFKLRQDGLQCAYHVEAKTASGDVTVPVGNHSYLRSSLHISALNKELGAAAANG